MALANGGRQLVICCDGTNNNLTGGHNDTNVVKLAALAAAVPAGGPLVFYDAGVGNPGELPGVTLVDNLRRRAERLAGLAFGRGVYENIADCYRFLMQYYRPGDEIYIFGFSRGAFTARSVGGLVNQFGILAPHMETLVPTLLHVYFADRKGRDQERQRLDIARQATALFAEGASREVEMQFVGVWDTVASVGMWPFSARFTAKPTIDGKLFLNVRHALALDEQRFQFGPRLYIDANHPDPATTPLRTARGNPATMQQLWFRGAHCDVGGYYPRGETCLSDRAFAWLVSEAVRCGLALTHGGQPLTTEALVDAALAHHYSPPGPPLVHSQVYDTPAWAVTGLAVRDTRRTRLDDGSVHALVPAEHPSVSAPLSFPGNTVWKSRRSMLTPVLQLVAIVLLMAYHGLLLSQGKPGGAMHLGGFFDQNLAFLYWQLGWWLGTSAPGAGLADFASPRSALAWDVLLIVLYALLLSRFVSAAFARLAGLRRGGAPVPSWLNALGWALPLAVFGDLAENLFTWLTICAVSAGHGGWAILPAALMSLTAAAKLAGLAGTLALVALGLASRR